MVNCFYFCDYETTRHHETEKYRRARDAFNVPKSTECMGGQFSVSSSMKRDECVAKNSVRTVLPYIQVGDEDVSAKTLLLNFTHLHIDNIHIVV